MTTWRAAMESALYGPEGFFRREAPADHFRTSVHASTLFAEALQLIAASYELRCVVDVGAGRGELLQTLHEVDPGLELIAVEIAPRPLSLPPGIRWEASFPTGVEALVVANEWLDNIPLDIAELDDNGDLRMVEVDPAGGEFPGSHLAGEDLAW